MRGASIILAAASALLIPSISAECAHDSPKDLAILAACGNQNEIANCLTEGEKCLYGCLVSSGCENADAQSFKVWYDNGCEEVRSFDGDLRRRQLIGTSAATVPTTPQVTTTESAVTVTALAQTTAEAPLVCLTTAMVSVTLCVTPTDVGAIGTTCIPTSTPSVSCNKGLYCTTTATGQNTCMRIENTPPLSGIIASSCLGAALAAMMGSLIFMACRSRVATRKARKQAEALAIAGGSNLRLGSSAMASSEAYLPLIHAQAPDGHRGDISADYAGGTGYGSHSRRPSAQSLTQSPSGSYQGLAGSVRAPSVPR